MKFFQTANWPNLVTGLRGLMAICLLWAFVDGWDWWLLCLIFNVGALTDWLDGWLARRLAAESDFGKVFDPLMDKALVWSGLVLLTIAYPVWWLLVTTSLLIARELLTDYWRWRLYATGRIMAASAGAKLKTTLQMILINAMFLHWWTGYWPLEWLAILVAMAAIVISVVSATNYGKLFYRLTRKRS